MSTTKFKVVIVGGGVSGLTLASSLEKANVDFVLLQGRDQIAPYVGASIAITANGGRILDQLDCYDTILDVTAPMYTIRTWHKGHVVNESDSPTLGLRRSGYPFLFMDRHLLLQQLYDSVRDKSKVLLNKRVSRVDHSHDGVSVQCKDGSTYTGDIVVGADGVHSLVRHEMWRHMSIAEPKVLPKDEQTLMRSEYNCMYGISTPTSGLLTGPFNQVVENDISFLHTVNKDGRVFWFIFSKLDKKYHVPNVPKFTKEDGEALAQRCLTIPMTESLTFKDLWNNRISFTLVPLEEAWFTHWTWGRFACVGDSIHKWTPNIGQGGNNAIESGAALANAIHELATTKSIPDPPSYNDITAGLKSYHRHREARAKATYTLANLVTRLEALKGPLERLMVLRVVPKLGEWVANSVANLIIGSEKLNFLPDPERSFQGTMAFNQNYGVGHEPSKLRRAFVALPFLLMAYFSHVCFITILSRPALQTQVAEFLSTHKIDFGTGQSWAIPNLFNPFPLLFSVFSPGLLNIDPVQRLQSLTFLVDVSPLYLLIIFEAHRRANVAKFCSIPILFGLAFQLRGIGVFGPIYFFLHYLQSPLDDYTAWDWRLINTGAAKTAFLSVFIAFTLPTFLMYTLPELQTRLSVNALFQVFPITVSILHYVLRKTLVRDTTEADRLRNVTADLPHVRFGVCVLAIISAATFNYVRFTTPTSLSSTLLPDLSAARSLLTSNHQNLSLVSGMALFLQLDWASCFVSAFAWLALLIRDMKAVEMTDVSWSKMAACALLGSYVAGPGAVVALAWLWREEILASKRARGAVVRPVAGDAMGSGAVADKA